MNKLKLNFANETGEILSKEELKGVVGGIGSEEYCATLNLLIDNNWSTWTQQEKESAMNAWNAHCK